MSKDEHVSDDVVFDAASDADTEAFEYDDTTSAAEVVHKLKEKLAACQTERQEYLDGWQRAKADIVNIKKRSADEQGAFLERMASGFIEELLPVLDSFDMAFKNREAWEAAPEQWRKGVEYIHSQLLTILTARGVTVLDPVGQQFNHNEHHSVATIPATEQTPDGTVVTVVRKGYKSGTTVIRPADVQVAGNM